MVIRIPNKIIIIAIALMLALYCYGAIRFNNKVRIYDTRIKIGDHAILIWSLLGRPSYYDGDYRTIEETSGGHEPKTKRLFLEGHRGILYLRSDIILIFDRDTGKLIEKKRGMYYSRMEY